MYPLTKCNEHLPPAMLHPPLMKNAQFMREILGVIYQLIGGVYVFMKCE